jgi:flagellar motor switch protein FliM
VLIVVQFDIEMEEMSGNIMICIPYMLIEPIRDRLYASFHTEEKTNIDSAWVSRFKHELMGVYVDLSVELGKTSITSRELVSLKKGDILVLEKDVADEMVVMVQNLPKYYARPGKIKDNLAVDIVSLVDKQLY